VTRARAFGAPLPAGGCIGVPAPASAYFNRSDVLRGVEWWEARGYRVKLAGGVFDRDDYVAGDPKTRARDLMAMFADDEVDVVHCLQGGFGSAQVLPHLDFDLIASNPKPLVGFSDITALHTALRQEAGLATFYGPGLMGVGDPERGAFSTDRLVAVLTGDGGVGEVPKDPDDPYSRAIRGGRATAPLAGGCLWLLMQSIGTPWEIDLDGRVFFFEDVDCPAWYIDGFLVQLAQSGKLDGVRAVVVGDLEKCDWREGRPEWPRTKSIEDVLEERLEPLGVPVLYGLPLGHGKHLATIPLGVTATLDADGRTLTIDEAALTVPEATTTDGAAATGAPQDGG
jgi:muramoyltetrapeptide carboxypeptidase